MKEAENEELYSQKFDLEIKTETKGADTKVTILHQKRMGFKYFFHINDDGTLEKTSRSYGSCSNSEKYLMIASVNCLALDKDADGCKYVLFLEGNSDIGTVQSIYIPTGKWSLFEQALKLLGANINGELDEPVEEIKPINYDTSSLVPTDEEIKEMIDLVDLDTFNKIIKNRLIKELPKDKKDVLGKINRKWARSYLKEWAISKYKFYKILGNKLSISKPIEIEANDYEMSSNISLIKDEFPLYRRILSDISASAFISKKVSKSNISGYFFNDKRVKSGMSITKLISLYGNKELDTAISKMYQDIGKNTVYISINPIDFLTVSINGSGWESCHHFLKGCYRNAGLSYMLDKTSLVAFTSKKEIPYSFDFPYNWNTKSWRQMIFMSEHSSTTVYSRQYPNESNELAKEVRTIFEELTCNYFNSVNKWKVYQRVKEINTRILNDNNALNYNDITNGFNHKVAKAKDDEKQSEEDILIGHEVKSLLNKDVIINGSDYYLLNNIDPDDEDYDEDEEDE